MHSLTAAKKRLKKNISVSHSKDFPYATSYNLISLKFCTIEYPIVQIWYYGFHCCEFWLSQSFNMLDTRYLAIFGYTNKSNWTQIAIKFLLICNKFKMSNCKGQKFPLSESYGHIKIYFILGVIFCSLAYMR